MPRCLGQVEDAEEPVLFLEDLSGAHWPPPWEAGQVEAVLRALEELWRRELPFEVPRLEDQRAEMQSWPKVREAPEQFLALGLCDAQWLEAALPALESAESRVRLDGDDLLHLDVRGDNLCFSQGRVLLLDWNWVCRGNGKLDVGAWLPSLHREGGPPPEAVLPGEPEVAAMLAGYWAWRAGQPAPTPGSRLREMQKYQLVAALGWAARELGLPPPAGS
jgi:thiamine kinase-like enzyme